MNKKEFITPEIEIIELEDKIIFSSGKDNGRHKGWNNPKNPHYEGEDDEY